MRQSSKARGENPDTGIKYISCVKSASEGSMRHEGFSYDVNVFDSTAVVNDPADLWSANCAVPEMIFECSSKFEQDFRIKDYKKPDGRIYAFPLIRRRYR